MEKIFSLIPQYCFQGHTHIPGVFTEDFRFLSPPDIDFKYQLTDEKSMINVGSIGQPRDGDCRSSYVILDDDDNSIEFRRIKYDVSLTSQKIYAISDLDKFLGDRLHDGK